MIARLRARALADEGMTLIEVVVSITLLGIIIGPVTAMILLGFLSSDGTRDRISDSVSAQLVSSYLVRDIQGATDIALDGDACGAVGRVKLQLEVGDPGSPETVAYVDQVGAKGQHELHRFTCGGGPATSTLLVANLAPDSGNLAVTCKDQAGALTPCGATARTVAVQVHAKRDSPQSTAYYEPFTFSLEATRRVT